MNPCADHVLLISSEDRKGIVAAVANSIDRAETRTRAMERTLKTVEALPDERVPAVLGPAVAAEDEGERAERD